MFRILIVDDSPADVLIMKALIQASGRPHQVLACASGCEALDFLYRRGQFTDETMPSLILLDINMPGMSGIDVLAAIKADPSLAMIPVVMLSTSSATTDVQSAYRAHANCYLQKPTSLEDAERLVRAVETFWMDFAVLPPFGEHNRETTTPIFNGPAAQSLVDAMRLARRREVDAHKKYLKAAEVAEDTSYSADGTAGMRRAAREYRDALHRHHAAMRAWTEYLQRRGEEALKGKFAPPEDVMPRLAAPRKSSR